MISNSHRDKLQRQNFEFWDSKCFNPKQPFRNLHHTSFKLSKHLTNLPQASPELSYTVRKLPWATFDQVDFSTPSSKQVSTPLEVTHWTFPLNLHLWLLSFYNLIFILGHLCSSISWWNILHSEPINGSWVGRMFCCWSYKLPWCLNLIENLCFWVVEGWRWSLARVLNSNKKVVTLWLVGWRANLFSFSFVLFILLTRVC